MTSHTIDRRRFIKTSTAAALSFPFVSSLRVLGANSRLNIAGIGVGGKGAVDIGYCSGENVVALCDVDHSRAASAYGKFPNARRFEDFRVMFEKAASTFDAVTVSTPDHAHALPAVLAMNAGKHVYCQKPLTHSVHEARVLTEMAREKGVVTQMGNQGHSHPGSRRMVEIIRAGVLGDITEVHVWTDRPIWPQGIERPSSSQPIPGHLNWDLWLGPAPFRPFHEAYVPFKWRGWWDFGTGALGDMGCHNMDVAFHALGLRNPVRVEALTSGVNEETGPERALVQFTFPKTVFGERPVMLTWYSGGMKPSPHLCGQTELPQNGYCIVGSDDTLYCPFYWGEGQLVSGTPLSDLDSIPQTLPRFPGSAEDNDKAHHEEWIEACKGNGQALSNFDYAGPMTEAVLLGVVALRSSGPLEWNAEKMEITNNADANRRIRKQYRKGWELPGS